MRKLLLPTIVFGMCASLQAITIEINTTHFPLGGFDSNGIRLSTASSFTTGGDLVAGNFDPAYTVTISAYRNIGSNAYFTATNANRLANESALVPNAVFSLLQHQYTGVTNTFSAIGVDNNIGTTGAVDHTNPTRSLAGQIDSGFGGGEAIVMDFSRPSAVLQLSLGYLMGNNTNSLTTEADPRTRTADIAVNQAPEIAYIRAKRANGTFRDFYMRVDTSFDTQLTTAAVPTASWFELAPNDGSGGNILATTAPQGGSLPVPAQLAITGGSPARLRFLGQWDIGDAFSTNIFGGADDIVRIELLPFTADGSGLTRSDFGFNNMTVTPEPWSILLGGTAIAALALRRRYMQRG